MARANKEKAPISQAAAGAGEKDYLWLNLKDLPYFRSLLRAVEARFYQDLDLPGPVLDVGCGDGHFASIAFEQPLDVGLDPWGAALKEARQRASQSDQPAYRILVQAQGNQIPFPDAMFGCAVSNSVLEHIPAVEQVLGEVGRVLKDGAPFYFCVPNHQFLDSLAIGHFFDQVGLRTLGSSYRSFFNRIARHYHCDPPQVWEKRLKQAGFEIEQWWHYYPPEAMQVSEWGHYLGLPSWLSHKLSGRWNLVSTRWNLGLTYALIRPYYEADPRCEDGVCTFYIARRVR